MFFMKNKTFGLKSFKRTIYQGGTPGFLLVGYWFIQLLFARSKADMGAVDSSAAVFAGYALLCGYFAYKSFKKGELKRHFIHLILMKTPLKWFILYTIVCFISSLWSPNPILSAYRAVECICMLLLHAAVIKTLLENTDEKGCMRWAVCYSFIIILLSITRSELAGYDLSTILYGLQFPATIFFYLAFFFSPAKWLKYPIEVCAIFCHSVTGYCGMVLGMCSLMFGKRKYRILGVVIGVAVLSSIMTYGLDNVLNNTVFASKGGAIVDGRIDENKTSGRDKLWNTVIEQVEDDDCLMTGYGFVVGEMEFARDLIGLQVIGLHNGFLSALVGTGLVGFVLFVLFIVSYVFLAFKKCVPKEYKSVLIASMCVVCVHTTGNPGLGFRVYGTWMPAMFIVMLNCGMYIRYRYKMGGSALIIKK